MCHLWSDVSGLLLCGNLFEPGDTNDVAAEAGLPFVNGVRIKALNGQPPQTHCAQRIEWLMGHARRHSEAFSSSEAFLARQRYLAEHPSAVAALKCMDGRINLSVATHTPLGIIQPFRNLGGMFNLGWPHLGEVLANYVHDQVSTGRRVLLLITYHYSKSDKQRDCAGFNFDTEAARAHTYAIKCQVEHNFGAGHGTVYPIVCGFETIVGSTSPKQKARLRGLFLSNDQDGVVHRSGKLRAPSA